MKRKRGTLPTKEDFESRYLLPPEGKGMTLKEIANYYGVHRATVKRWRKKLGIPEQDRYERVSYHNTGKRKFYAPSKNELSEMYLLPPEGKGMTQDEIALFYGVSRAIITRWIRELDLQQPHSERHSFFVSGSKNHAYRGGKSRNFHKNILTNESPEIICTWCGNNKNVQVHHIDHNTDNGKIENLMWLCHHCNMLEAHLWNLSVKKLANWRVVFRDNKRKIIIVFGDD